MTSYAPKIAVVIPKYGLIGGAEIFASELTERIAQNGRYDVHVFANRWRSSSNNITFHKIPFFPFPRFLTTISFAYFARLQISKANFDLIHAHDRVFDADIFTMHGIPHRIWTREIRKKTMSLFDYATEWVEKRLVANPRCMRFVSVSNLAKDKFLEVYKSASDRVRVIHPGIEVKKFTSLDRQLCREEIRKLHGIGMSDVVILFVSMNFEIKGLDEIMKAVGVVKSKDRSTRLRLLVVGRGDQKKYSKLAQNLGIEKDVVFAGVREKDIEKTYLASDMFSILSRFDTFGISVLEAMAASLPVIISSRVGAKDLVRNGVNGFIVEDPGNTQEVSEKIGFVIEPENRDRMAREALGTALVKSWDSVFEETQAMYTEILNKKRIKK